MSDLFLDSALLPGGWARDVRVSIDSGGWITAIDVDTTPQGARHVPGIAVPGVPNVHSHVFQRAMAGLAERGSPEGDSFWTWRTRMYSFLEKLGPDEVEAVAAQLFVELLLNGFTSVAEFHYLRNDPTGQPYDDPVEMARRILAAGEQTGLGLTMLPTVYRTSDFGGASAASGQRRFVASIEEFVGDVAVLGADMTRGTARVGVALHSLRAVPPSEIDVVVTAARSMDPTLPIHIHVAEQVAEVEASLAAHGARPVKWLLDNAPVDEHWCLVHATHVDAGEVTGMAQSRAVVGLCPTTEANLGDGVFPLEAYEAAGGRWAIGTDSHVGRNPATELRSLEYGQRLTTRRRSVSGGTRHKSTGRSMLDQAWDHGAQACGRRVGRLAIGYRADIVVLDPDHPALAGREEDDALDSWLFSGDRTPVRHVFTGDRWVVRDGHHVLEDEIVRSYRDTVRALARSTPQLGLDLGDED